MTGTAESFTNAPTGTVTSGGSTTSDTAFTVTPTNPFPVASTTPNPNTVFRIVDVAAPTEIMLVTVAPGGGSSGQSWTVTRGADGTVAVTHAANWTCQQIVSQGTLQQFVQQEASAITTPVVDTANGTAATIISFTPAPGNAPAGGVAYSFVAFGTLTTTSTAPTLTFTVAWNGVTLATLKTATQGTALSASMSNDSWWLEGFVVCFSPTSMVAGMNFQTHKTTTVITGVGVTGDASAALAGVTVSGSGPLTLTATWSSASNSLSATGFAQRAV